MIRGWRIASAVAVTIPLLMQVVRMTIWRWFEECVNEPSKKRDKQNQRKQASLNNRNPPLPRPKPENNYHTDYLVKYAKKYRGRMQV